MSVLSWDKPKQLVDSKTHGETYIADGAPPGVYMPNMSDDDARKWRAQLIARSKDPRVEIRTASVGANMVMIVRPHEVEISSNGRMWFDDSVLSDFQSAILEAREKLSQNID